MINEVQLNLLDTVEFFLLLCTSSAPTVTAGFTSFLLSCNLFPVPAVLVPQSFHSDPLVG